MSSVWRRRRKATHGQRLAGPGRLRNRIAPARRSTIGMAPRYRHAPDGSGRFGVVPRTLKRQSLAVRPQSGRGTPWPRTREACPGGTAGGDRSPTLWSSESVADRKPMGRAGMTVGSFPGQRRRVSGVGDGTPMGRCPYAILSPLPRPYGARCSRRATLAGGPRKAVAPGRLWARRRGAGSAVTSRLEDDDVVQDPDAATPAGAPAARLPAPDRRLLYRPRSCTATRDATHHRPAPLPPRTGTLDVSVESREGVIVMTPIGTLPDPLPAGLVAQLEVSIAARPVIVDLSQITLVLAAPMMGLAAWVLGASHQPDWCCVVCPRPTARALLRKWHVTRCVATFGSVGDALQARRFAADGYGAGWYPDSPGRPPLKSGSERGLRRNGGRSIQRVLTHDLQQRSP
jgi:hypothetical protein